jgi:tetratricopeptide (TPR) repeat protein
MCKAYSNSARVAEARFAQGDALTELGEFAGAILAFDEIIKKFPPGDLVDRARGRKGDCQFTLGADRPERFQEALASYRLVFESGTASPELKLQAEFKMGRCLEKMKRKAEAFEHFMNVVYGWLALRDAGHPPDSLWFTRAAFGAAALKDGEGDGDAALRIYERVRDAGIPASRDAQKRIEKMTGAQAP